MLIVVTPCYYVAKASAERQPLLRSYHALLPYRTRLTRNNSVFIAGAYAVPIFHYFGIGDPVYSTDPRALDYSVLNQIKLSEKLADFLDARKVTHLFLDDDQWGKMESAQPGIVQDLIDHGEAAGWRLVGFEDSVDPEAWPPVYLSRWLLFEKAISPDGGVALLPTGLAAGRGREAFAGWQSADGLGPVEGPLPARQFPSFRWGYGPATTLTVVVSGASSLSAAGDETARPLPIC